MRTVRWSRTLGAVGGLLLLVGVLLLGFVAQQLWGTGLHESRAQDDLRREFAARLAAADGADGPGPGGPGATVGTSTGGTTTTTSVASGPAPAATATAVEGEPAARLVIPRIGVDKIVVEGVDLSDLRRGPGHYPSTPLPGQAGNAAIAGHRTTYGAPFNRIDELVAGDEIIAETTQGRFRYLVREHRIVDPSEVSVLTGTGRDQLTLTACHPRYSARQRIVVIAELLRRAGTRPVPPGRHLGDQGRPGHARRARRHRCPPGEGRRLGCGLRSGRARRLVGRTEMAEASRLRPRPAPDGVRAVLVLRRGRAAAAGQLLTVSGHGAAVTRGPYAAPTRPTEGESAMRHRRPTERNLPIAARSRLVVSAAVLGALLIPAACSSGSGDEFRSGIEDGFSDAGLDLDDSQVDCVTDRVVRALGGEDGLDNLTEDYDSLSDVPGSVQSRITAATADALESCEIDVTDTTTG